MIGGILLEDKKESTLLHWRVRRPKLPERVRLPLFSSRERGAEPCVRVGDRVKVGDVVAVPVHEEAVFVHASVSGEVAAIEEFPHPFLGHSPAVEIVADQEDEILPEIGTERTGWDCLAAEELLRIFRQAGLVDMANPGVGLHAKIKKYAAAGAHTVVLNACESEPYVTAAYTLIMSRPVEILKGAEILRRALQAKKIVVITEKNKLDAAELLKSKIYFLKWDHIDFKVLPPLHPQGHESVLMHEVTGVNPGLARTREKKEAAVFDVATAFSAYEAAVLQKPLYERVVTVGGECVVEPKNLWIRLGSSLEDCIKRCKGFLREPRKVVTGGPIKGEAHGTLDIPVLKTTSSVLALPKEVAKPEEVQPCIRCGRCIEACPVEISPVMITQAAEHELFEVARDFGATLCIECGNCSYVCPSKRPMVELLRYAASHIE